MAVVIRIFGQWTIGTGDDGVWSAITAPNDVAVALNAMRETARVPGMTVDQQRLEEARVLYPGLEVVTVGREAAGIH